MSRLLTASDIIFALGYNPYDSSNPNAFVDAAFFNTHVPLLGAPKDAPHFTGLWQFDAGGVILGPVDLQSGLLTLSNQTAILTLGKAGSLSSPLLRFLANAAPGRLYDAAIEVTGGTGSQDGAGVINFRCNAFTINGSSVATTGVGAPGTNLPLPEGATALVGTSVAFAREDHVHQYPLAPIFGINTSTAASVAVNGATGSNRPLKFQTAGSDRWRLGPSTTAESGSNVGADFVVARYSDTGTLLGTAFTVVRSNGHVLIGTSTDDTDSALKIQGLTRIGSAGAVAPSSAVGSNINLLQLRGANATAVTAAIDTVAGDPALAMRRVNGTSAAPTAAAAGDRLASLQAFSYGATAYTSVAAEVRLSADQAFTDSAWGARVGFFTCGIGGVSPTERMRITADGRVLIGTTTDDGTTELQIVQAGAGTTLSLKNTSTSGAQISLQGDGATTPNKIVRARGGQLEVVNSGNTAVLATLTDAGALALITTGAAAALTLTNTTAGVGAQLSLHGDGVTTPNKIIRARAGALEVVNSANSAVIATMGDDGSLALAGPASVPADPTTALQLAPKQYIDARPTVRNVIGNPLFRINQRAAGSVTTSNGYPCDRWRALNDTVNGTRSMTRVALVDSDRTAIGDSDARFALNMNVTGSAVTTSYELMATAVEDARTFQGKTVTVSFWAVAAAATSVAVELQQNFGTGGSPSTPVVGIGAAKFALTTGWARYQATFAVPSTTGKTLGTTGDDSLLVFFWLSGGSSFNARNGTLGAQTNNVTIWGFQLEQAPAATAVEKLPFALDQVLCRRYYQTGSGWNQSTAAAANALIAVPITFSPPMIGAPGATLINSTGSVNAASISANARDNLSGYLAGQSVAAGALLLQGLAGFSADI